MSIIGRFTAETPDGKSSWTNQNVLSLVHFPPLTKPPRLKYAIWLRVNILRWLRGATVDFHGCS